MCDISWLVEYGYAIASISYRLSAKAIFPAQIHDCKAAVRWLRANGEKYGYRTDRITVAGRSAGGHLAALLGRRAALRSLRELLVEPGSIFACRRDHRLLRRDGFHSAHENAASQDHRRRRKCPRAAWRSG